MFLLIIFPYRRKEMKRKLVLLLALLLLFPVITAFSRGKVEPDEVKVVEEKAPEVAVKEYLAVDPLTTETEIVKIAGFKEAPELAAQVKAGKIPSVEERLPEEPLVIKPIEKIGKYGGSMIFPRGQAEAKKGPRPNYMLYEMLVTFTNPKQDKIYPNVAKSWEVSADGKVITFFLRKGMKWSDGEPFTSDDILFWYEDIYMNDELYPNKTNMNVMSVGGELGKVTKVDNYTVNFSFATSPGDNFIRGMARFRPVPYAPKHYLMQFHPNYTARDKIDAMVKDGKYDSWSSFFRDQREWTGGLNPKCPVISPWKRDNEVTEPVNVWKRNPYYWKVDTEGNQLPYLDEVQRPVIASAEARMLKVLAGEFSLEYMWSLGGLQAYSTVMESRDKGDYRVIQREVVSGNNFSLIFLNYAHKDPVMRKLFLDKRFRHALSYALDRQEVNDLIYYGLARIVQFGFPPGPPFYGEDPIFDRYMKRDLAEAGKLLDALGLDKRDSEGFRLRPDGKKLEIVNSVEGDWVPVLIEIAELYKKHWKDIGIRVVNKPQNWSILLEKRTNAEFDMLTSGLGFGTRSTILSRGKFFPVSNSWEFQPQYGMWFDSGGKEGTEPPPEVKRLRAIWEELTATTDEAKFEKLLKEAADIHTEEQIVIGGITPPGDKEGAWIAKKNLRNLNAPGMGIDGWMYTIPSATIFFE
jgi:peptide/nickel transport system substrate-binding protein